MNEIYVVTKDKEIVGVYSSRIVAEAAMRATDAKLEPCFVDEVSTEKKAFHITLNMDTGDMEIDKARRVFRTICITPDMREFDDFESTTLDRWQKLYFRITAADTISAAVWVQQWRETKLNVMRHANRIPKVVGDKVYFKR